MNTIQNLLVDTLNGFPKGDIPLYIFQLICAGILAHALQFLLNKKMGEPVLQYSVLIVTIMSVLASIVKYSEPASILAAAVILLLLGNKQKSKIETIAQVLIVLIGIGCGLGSVVQTTIGAVVIFAVILFTPLKSKS